MSVFRKFSANYIYTGKGVWLRNGIIKLNDTSEIRALIDTKGILKESSGMSFFNGLIIPGWFLMTISDAKGTERISFPLTGQDLHKLGCRYTIHLGNEEVTYTAGNGQNLPQHIDYVHHPFVLPGDLPELNRKDLTLSLYHRPNGLLLKTTFNKIVDKNSIITLLKIAGKLKATLLFQGDIKILSELSQLYHPSGVSYVLTANQLLDQENYHVTLTTDILQHSCFYWDPGLLTTPFDPARIFFDFLRYRPAVTFETLINWFCVNPSTILGLNHQAGFISTGKMPGLVLVTPFDFEKRKLLPESRFIALD